MNQHLFSIDPIGAIENVKEAAIRYLKWAYRIDNASLNKQRIDLLSLNGNLFQSPYMELLPEYAQHPKITDVSDIAVIYPNEAWMKEFFDFIKKGLMAYPPYLHQVEMLERAFIHRRNTVITSGTGSGKTESFLLPVFAQIYKEAKTWKPVSTSNPKWFEDNPYTPCQRQGENRKAAVRAMILYPMNALVEDQMARLRKALDSDDVRAHFDSVLGGNRIYFGRYNGETIGQKSYAILQANCTPRVFDEKRNHISETLGGLHQKFSDVLNLWTGLSSSQKKDQEEMLYISPRLDGKTATAEMLTRWDMQKTPPDIMVTNTSMLSIILMREAEKGIFDQTREWLRESEDNVFQLVVDELHLYRGTAGSEVACLLRMLYRALGLEPVIRDNDGKHRPNPQLRILASSASLGDDRATQKFMKEFFGIYDDQGLHAFDIQKGYPYSPTTSNYTVAYDEFKFFTPAFLNLDENSKRNEADNFAQRLGYADIKDFIEKLQNKIFDDVTAWFGGNARKFDDLYGQTGLFASGDAARGFLIFRGYADTVMPNKLPRIRFHQFFKYIEGLWGELHSQAPFISSLSYTAHETGPQGNKILELLRCESCGELYLGGNRKGDVSNPNPYMTLNYPDLNQIPSSNPTPMVQNKSYADYVIFWPTDKTALSEEIENHVAATDCRTTKFAHTHAECVWEHAYLDPANGKLESTPKVGYIPGWVYRVKPHNGNPDYSKILALPCECPHCAQNFIKRKYTKSPIRSFRVGIDRVNQLLSKELIYQLSEKSPKLVGFSDSRNDAARQAYGIELEHYRDMVRKTMLDHVDLIRRLTSRQIKKEIRNLQDQGMRDRQIEKEISQMHHEVDESLLKTIIDTAFDLIDNVSGVTQQSLDALAEEIPLNPLVNSIFKELVRLGINPGGVDFSKQYTENSQHWSTLYDFATGVLLPNANTQGLDGQLRESLVTAIFANSFGKYMGVSTIDSGMGHIGCKRSSQITNSQEFRTLKGLLNLPDKEVFDFTDAYIRILGDNYRYKNTDFEANDITSYQEASATLKKPIKKYATDHGLSDTALGNALYALLHHGPTDNATYLHPSGLSFFPTIKGEVFYRCPKCQRIHLTSGLGMCTNTNCQEDLPRVPSGKVEELWDHFVAHDIKISPRDARRLHTEELTGQTDNAPERLLQFKGIILNGEPLAHEIDMISVTTTMEVGVDIGSLQAVYQGNMPPTRYNYQQRVGRGGRRGQAFSTAFTFCRGRSHDTYYYLHDLEHMVSSDPQAPTLSLAPFSYTDYTGKVTALKTSIFKRVVVKSIFREAIGTQMSDYDLVDTAGEFGRVREWNKTRKIVDMWLKNNPAVIADIVSMYMSQFDRPNLNEVKKMVDWVTNAMLTEIDGKVQNANNMDIGLAQFMAEKGLLPKYGLPSEGRLFYHRYDRSKDRLFEIGRDVEISITEFAPGQEIVKDKGKFVVKALTCPFRVIENGGGTHFIFFNTTSNDALSDSYRLEITGNEVIAISSEQGGNTDTLRLVIPQAYRTQTIADNKGKNIDNNDNRNSYSSSLIFASHLSNGKAPKISFGNLDASLYGTQAHDNAEIWHVNTNGGRFFKGHYALPTDRRIRGNVMTEDKGTFFFDETDGQETIALGSKKATEMICLQIKATPKHVKHVNLDVRSGHRAAILAAFYSAGTLIQRSLADKLDVEPEEIEISLKIDQQSGIPQIYLSDALPNGANLVGHMFEEENLKLLLEEIADASNSFMKGIISPEHAKSCTTTCHNCLQTYSNRGLHHVLDWRLGVGIIRIMLGQPYDFGMTLIDPGYYELADKDTIHKICGKRLGMPKDATSDSVTKGFSIKRRSVWHPLWDIQSAGLVLSPGEVELYDTFRVLRTDLTGIGSITVNEYLKNDKEHAEEPSNSQDSEDNGDSYSFSTEGKNVDPDTGIILDVEL